MDARSALLVRRSKDTLSIAYSRKVSRKEDLKRDMSFKIRKPTSTKTSIPQIQPVKHHMSEL
jgi:hypothetical protein